MISQPLFNPEDYPQIQKLYYQYYDYIKDQKYLHSKSALYYERLNRKLTIPSISFTGLSSILSFVVATNILNQQQSNYLSIGVGVLTSINTVLQTISTTYGFDAKAKSHRNASEQYDSLLINIQFEKNFPDSSNFLEELERKISEIKSKYKEMIPQFIQDKYYQDKTNYYEKYYIKEKLIYKKRKILVEQLNNDKITLEEFKNEYKKIIHLEDELIDDKQE